MKIIISPAKKMNLDVESNVNIEVPVFISKAEILMEHLKSLSYGELKRLLSCNDQICQLNYERYQHMDLRRLLTPALFAYEGIQYQYMAPRVFSESQLEYVQGHLRILSGFYGLLKPFDGVASYRLEMGSRFKTPFCNSLYDFWGEDIYNELIKDDDEILNLASSEYNRAIEPYITAKTRYVTCFFGEMQDGAFKEKGVYVKMARGSMVRFMAQEHIEDIEGIKGFTGLGFSYSEKLSSYNKLYFIK